MQNLTMTDEEEYTPWFYFWIYFGVWITIGFIICIALIMLIFTMLSFPFYYLLYQKNRSKEEASPLYPIQQHFFRWSNILFSYYTWILLISLLCLIYESYRENLEILLFYSVVLAYILSSAVSPVFNILLIFLAVKRFSLFFLEDSERFLNLKSIYLWVSINFLYLSSIFCSFYIRFQKLFLITNNGTEAYIHGISFTNEESLDFIDNSIMNVFLSSEFLSAISVIAYIPMFKKVQRLSYLPSFANSQPEKYIKYQILFIFASKTIILLVSFVGSETLHYLTGLSKKEAIFVVTNIATFQMTPVIIQTTYIFCNKKNVRALISYISIKPIWLHLKRILWRKTSSINAVVPLEASTRY
ncbi:hypothetical protein CRE_14508 [Caenorhabditis remanei]|uniref:Serpentine Receptor, class Z n=1 Tax=Caenorhabditis remanei TaxID=31234 RepID=E3M997_CAERE|nr:hypothetical protein CRE_14508 [Caenorhabditis remanei]